MTHIKHPVVAGLFYPGTPQELQHTVDAFMRQAHPPAEQRPRALIAPHAGYRYSGPIAASAYATLRPWADAIRRVAVLAPSHRVPFRGVALSSAEVFETPLGDIPVDMQAVKGLTDLPGVLVLDAAFAEEHGETPEIVHAIAAHHNDEKPTSPLAHIVAAAGGDLAALPVVRASCCAEAGRAAPERLAQILVKPVAHPVQALLDQKNRSTPAC